MSSTWASLEESMRTKLKSRTRAQYRCTPISKRPHFVGYLKWNHSGKYRLYKYLR